MLLTVLLFICGILLAILCVIGIHEAGHFLAARLVNVGVLRFSLGFGPILWSRYDNKGTEYAISLIPLGGYVKLLESTDENNSINNKNALAFPTQPFWKKFTIIAAGPLFNILFALLMYWIIFLIGFTSVVPVIGDIQPHSIAATAGLKSQQEIVKIDDIATASWLSVIIRIISHTGNHDTIIFETRPLGKTQPIKKNQLDLANWQLNDLKPDPLGSLGITPYLPSPLPKNMLRDNRHGPLVALQHAARNTIDFVSLNFIMLAKLVTGKVSLQSLGGPISIFSSAGNAFRQGLIAFMSFLAFLSIAIGVINVLPIPGLDGGHLVIQSIEGLMKRPISPKTLSFIYSIGMIAIVLISIQAIINDLLRFKP